MVEKTKVAVMISGRGSNMIALHEACKSPNFPAEIMAVLSDKPEAQGLNYARENNIQAYAIVRNDFEDKRAFEQAILNQLGALDYQCLCLAGFMRVLSADFLSALSDKHVINIHPSLLPKFKGLNVHERVLEAGEESSGCSVHYVTAEVDSGDIIVQEKVEVFADDTPEKLAARVLEKEHVAYPKALRIVAERIVAEKIQKL